ncbi:MAG: arylsulfatase [Acidimicrobiia bacterium]|nr:arylsulfatase [Acidimicrobiia bacterium]
MPATTFDPIASPTVEVGPTREPQFVHEDQVTEATGRLDGFRGRHGRGPNLLVILMDDVGWGDFGCYGGGVAVGAPTPNIDRLARRGLLMTSCYSEPSCTPSRASLLTGRLPMRHGLHRPPMYGEPGGLQGEITMAELLSDAGYVTQAVGKWHLGENVESQPQHVGFDDFYGFLSVSDMYSEWRDPYFFPEVVYSEARTEWVQNMEFNRSFVHATRDGDVEPVEEVTIPVLSRLDDMWCEYTESFVRRMAGGDQPWFCYLGTRGAHFDNYPLEKFLGSSPAKHPYKDTIIELDSIVGRLVDVLEETGQADSTLIFLSSDNGPHMENWPDAAFTPFRCAKGSTWEGGVRVPGIMVWPDMVEADRASDGLFSFTDLLPTMLSLAGAPERIPTDRFIDGIDQTSFLLSAEGLSNRKYVYYWLLRKLSALRAGEYKFMLASTSDDDTDVAGPGGFTGITQDYTYPRLFNLYLDPKEQHSYLTRKLAYNEAFIDGIRAHLMSYRDHPPKHIV